MTAALSLPIPAVHHSRPELKVIQGGATFRAELAAVLPLLLPRALQLCRNRVAAHDLIQDTAERALRFEQGYQQGTNLKAWLSRVLYCIFVTQARRRSLARRTLTRVGGDPSSWFQMEGAPEMCTLTPKMEALVRALPEGFADALLLVEVHGLAYREAAEEMGVPLGTVMSRISRARRLLRERLLAVEKAA